MAYTTMKTWTSEVLTSSDMTTYLTNNIEYLKSVTDGLTASGVDLVRNATQSIPDATTTLISWDTEQQDYGGWWSSGSVITVPGTAIPSGSTAVLVIVRARISYASNGTGLRRIRVLRNGASVASMTLNALTGSDTDYQVVDFASVGSADTLTVEAYQTSTGSLNATQCDFSVFRMFPLS